MKSRSLQRARQHGFTLVELSIVLVIAGLILLSVLKGTDAINKAKAERAVADLREMQGMLLEFQKRVGRLPGDCNNDGRIGFFSATAAGALSGGANLLDATEANRTLPNTATDTGGTATCVTSATVETVEELAWNDMRRFNVIDTNRLPREIAKNVNGSYYSVGMMQGTNANDVANVIVVYNIPVWMAEAIDAAIDGTVQYDGSTSNGNAGRIRRWDGNTAAALGVPPISTTKTFSNGYMKMGETRDSMIAISYQFDTTKLPN